MELITYSFSKKTNSTAQPGGGTSHDVKLKNDCSILNPVFIIDGTSFKDANYCKWNGRFYYIDDVIFLSNNLIELHCSVDALASWRSYIVSSSKYVTRIASTAAYDETIADDRYPTFAVPVISQTTITNTSIPHVLSEGVYVVTAIGLNPLNAATSQSNYYIFEKGYLNKFLSDLVDQLATKALSWTDIVKRVVYLPVSYAAFTSSDGYTDISQLKLGAGDQFSAISTVCKVINGFGQLSITEAGLPLPAHPQASTRGKWLNGSRTTEGTLLYGPIGVISIPVDKLINAASFGCTLFIDVIGGGATFRLFQTDSSGNKTTIAFHEVSGFGVDTLVTQQQFSVLKSAEALGAAITSAMSGNFLGSASGIANAMAYAAGTPEAIGSNGGRAKFGSGLSVIYAYYKLVNEDLADQGRPLCRVISMADVSGYVECADVHAPYPCTEEEKRTIENTLTTGCYIE